MNKETTGERCRGVAHETYGSLSCDRQVLSTLVILKRTTWPKIIKILRYICTAEGRDVRGLVDKGHYLNRSERGIYIEGLN